MSLQAPKLDSRTFAELVKEARDRIPRFTPDWTNFNDADPGMTLVKLQAWLTETLLYELNRVPELNYIKFLQLLNVSPVAATAARTELQFRLKKLDQPQDPLQLFIPRRAQIEADDADLTEPVIFETDRSLRAFNASVAAIITSTDNAAAPQMLVSSYDSKKAHLSVNQSFFPFGENPQPYRSCLVGVLLRPHRKDGVDYSQDIFPSGELDLAVSAVEVFEADHNGQPVTGPMAKQALLPHQLQAHTELVRWQVYVGSAPDSEFSQQGELTPGWHTLHSPLDGSAALSRSGHLSFSLPEDISQISLHQLPRSLWLDMALKKPPQTMAELLDDLADDGLNFDLDSAKAIPWQDIIPAADLNDVIGECDNMAELISVLAGLSGSNNIAAVPRQQWLALDVGYSDPAIPAHAMAWLRVQLLSPASDSDNGYQNVLLNGFYLNTVPATAAVTRLEEVLGHSDGRPAQQFKLAKTPVFVPAGKLADIELDVVEAGQAERWQQVSDFFASDSDAAVYVLDPQSGQLTFGDGVYGRIPVAGAAVIARQYRYGGGVAGNVGANSVTKIKTSLPLVDSVSNLRPALGGSAAETLQQVKMRAPHQLKHRDRAVTAADFAELAQQTPGVPIHTAYALAQTALQQNDNTSGYQLVPRQGAVTVVILPANIRQASPQPSDAQLDAVCRYLDQRRLITTELYVTGPRYLAISKLALEVRAAHNADLATVSDAVYQHLLDYFHPLRGGETGQGWPFGEDLYLGNLYQRLLAISGVKRVQNLQLQLAEQQLSCQDVLSVPDGHLLQLNREHIALKVSYE